MRSVDSGVISFANNKKVKLLFSCTVRKIENKIIFKGLFNRRALLFK